MEKMPTFEKTVGSNFEKVMQDVKPFYERPDEVKSNLTEVAPQPGEADDDFYVRADEELAKQYPSSSEDDRFQMVKNILTAEQRQADPQYGEKQQKHEILVDDDYKQQLAKLQGDYKDRNNKIKELQESGIFSSEATLEARTNNKKKWLNDRKEAFEKYEKAFHERADADKLQVEDIEDFRRKEMNDLNDEHERMVNYEAERLGISYSLDDGLITRLVEGDFSKEPSAEDLKQSVRRGIKGGDTVEAERFIDRLWKPELEVIKRNAVMRLVADPVRSKNVIGPNGQSHDESYFVLPIGNQEFEEYVTENLKDGDGMTIMCAGLSKALKYGTKEEAINRAGWFYDLAHDKIGFNTDDILTGVEAAGIASGENCNSKWLDRYNNFVANVDWNTKEEERNIGQEVKPAEEIYVDTIRLKEELERKLKEYNIQYDKIGKTKGRYNNNEGDDVSGNSVDLITQLSRDIVLLNRSIQHIEGTKYITKAINEQFGDIIQIGETKYLDGAWATARCKVSAFKIESPASVGEVWAFTSEGTTDHEQNLYYGMTDSLDSIKELFSGVFYRIPNMVPNIESMNVLRIRHHLMPDNIRDNVKNGWSEDDIKKLKGMTEYREIAEYFVRIINDDSYGEKMITKDEMNMAEAVADIEDDDKIESIDTEVEMPSSQKREWFREYQAKDNTSAADTGAQNKNNTTQVSDRDIFDITINSRDISGPGRNLVKDKYNSLNELARTPRKVMKQLFSDADIRKIAEILDQNEREHVKWFDE